MDENARNINDDPASNDDRNHSENIANMIDETKRVVSSHDESEARKNLKDQIERTIFILSDELKSINRQYDSRCVLRESFERLTPTDFDYEKFNGWKEKATKAMRAKNSQIYQLERCLGDLRETADKAIAHADVLFEVAKSVDAFVTASAGTKEKDEAYGGVVRSLEKLDRHWPRWSEVEPR
jgi:hypothetical protein